MQHKKVWSVEDYIGYVIIPTIVIVTSLGHDVMFINLIFSFICYVSLVYIVPTVKTEMIGLGLVGTDLCKKEKIQM